MTSIEPGPKEDPDLLPIAELCDGQVSRRTDGWRHLIYMEGLRFLANGVMQKMDAVLCLNHNNPAYPTKLYLAEKVGEGLNWNETAYILARTWHTFSWRDVRFDQHPIDILAAHLAALNQRRAA
jgi:hypothetical protein